MRFVVAIVAFVIAAAAIGLGVAQRTILAGPDSISSHVVTGDATLTVIDGDTLNSNAGTQSIEIAGTGAIMLAYGRSADVAAWVGEAAFNRVGWDAETQELTTTVVRGSDEAVPSPVGSDLWVREFTGTDTLTRKIKVPLGVSVIIAADGTLPAPADISITWPLDNSAPFSGPLVVAGIFALLGGLAAFLWALVHARRRRGPRRKSPKLPKRPRPPQLKPDKKRGLKQPDRELEPSRTSGRRRAFIATGTLLVGVLALSGCTTAEPDPSASATDVAALAALPVAVTEGQFANILTEVVQTVADADAARDPAIAAVRLAGPALALRTANYAIRAVDAAVPALLPIPNDQLQIVLPQQSDSWPRSVFAVVSSDDTTVSPVALVLTQDAPRDNYKVQYAMALIATVPDVAPVELGAPYLDASNTLGLMAPNELAAAYGDILINGESAASYDLFQADGDSLRAAIGPDYKAARAAQLPGSASITFTNGPSADPAIAFLSNDSGQLMSVVLNDVETVKPLEAGAAVNPSGQVKALLNKAQSTRGVIATYSVQLLFYVPQAGSDKQIVLLGYAQGLIAATEVG